MNVQQQIQAAKTQLQQGHALGASQTLERLVAAQPAHAEGWNLLALAYAKTNRLPAAREAIAAALKLAPSAGMYLTAANIEQDLGALDSAIAMAQGAVRLQPEYPEAFNNLGILLSDAGRIGEAMTAFSDAVRLRPGYARAWANLASACLRTNQAERAREAAVRAVEADPNYAHGFHMLGQALRVLEKNAEAEQALRRALQLQPQYVEVLLLLSRVLSSQFRYQEALEVLQRALAIAPGRTDLWVAAGELLAQQDDLDAAAVAFQRALAIRPGDLETRVRHALLLPSIYQSSEHLAACRQRFSNGLDALLTDIDALLPSVTRQNLNKSLPPNFLLAYQGLNDRELQRKYAQLVERTLAHVLPEFTTYQRAGRPPGGRIRIGFCSRFFYNSTVGNYFASWITDLDRSRFEVFVYYGRNTSDHLSSAILAAADHFHQQENTAQELARKILADSLDLLVYPEIGMDQAAFLLSSLRLAPVQACGWGHPVTPGHRAIDYYISCAEMEPADAQAHYNERLLLLPGIGTRYRMPEVPAASKHKTRADFQLPDGKVLYLFPQSLFKVHPDTDRLLVEILAQNSDAVLVMFASHSPGVTQRFVARLQRAFAAAGLPSAGRVKILPGLDHGDYKRVNELCDVMLDSLHWSGGNTSLDALAAALPIITLPGAMMRGRQSAAMLSMIGLRDLVAADPKDYVNLAVALGKDAVRRQQLAEKIRANRHQLIDDPRPTRQLNESFAMMAAGTQPPPGVRP